VDSVRSTAAAFCVIPLLAISGAANRLLPQRIPAVVPAIALAALRDSNDTNDFRRFEAALAVAKSLAEAMPIGAQRNDLRRSILVYEDIDAIWGFAVHDHYGAYFNDDSLPGMRDRLNADYPDYEAFIAEYRVTDRKGNILYPTAETRAFLLKVLAPPAPKPPVTTQPPS
jgi:hypothetical protein